jgi:beta-glucanase (GH16 family)
LLFSLTATGCGSGLHAPKSPSSRIGEWVLTWSDDFSAADGSSPDASKWTYDLGGNGWGNQELQSYTSRRQNVQIEGGNLVITARQEKYTGADGIARNYTSTRLKTQSLFSQAYGRFEARIRIPTGQGIWPAFWMLGSNLSSVDWPKCGEIDIMENIGREPGTVHGSLHGPSSVAVSMIMMVSTSLPSGQSYSEDFHVYAVEWEPGTVKFFVDSNHYATLPSPSGRQTGNGFSIIRFSLF